MKLRNLYLLTGIVSLVFALALLLMTSVMLQLLGMDVTRDAVVLCQLLSVELTVSGALILLARDVTDAKARTAISYGNMIAGVLGFLVTLNAILTGVLGWFGFVLLLIYAVMVVGFGYFQFFTPKK